MFLRDLKKYRNPWPSMRDDFDRLQNEMQRIFGGLRSPFAPEFPAMNIWSNAEGARVTAELPGVSINDLDISVRGSTLTLSGKRELADDAEYFRRERNRGGFTRSFDFPFMIDHEGVDAKLAKGVLEIKVPRAEEDKPRKISITAG